MALAPPHLTPGRTARGEWQAIKQVKLHLLLCIPPHNSHYGLNHPPPIPPHPPGGKTVFHETCPWFQKGWRLLL